MKERMDEVKKFLEKKEKITRLDLILALLVALFTGVLIGFLTSPRRQYPKYIGCFNGNYNGDFSQDGADGQECDCEGGQCCEECDEERCCGETEYCGGEERCCEEGKQA